MRCCRRSAGSKSAFDDLNAQTTSGSYLAFQTDNVVVSYDEIEVSRFKKYYEAGGVRVAMREAETVSFLLTDHLGSTAVTADSNGTRTGELWYKPWGGYRGTAFGATPTSYRFTGQREDATIGLHFYGARYCDPVLGRFTQPDTVVPEPGNPGSLNRYSYVLNNPLKYVDPTGHFTEEELLQWGVFIGPNQMQGLRAKPPSVSGIISCERLSLAISYRSSIQDASSDRGELMVGELVSRAAIGLVTLYQLSTRVRSQFSLVSQHQASPLLVAILGRFRRMGVILWSVT